MLFPISKKLSLEGVLRDPGLFGVPGLEVLAESLFENISASRFRECLNCDSESRLYAQENDKTSLVRKCINLRQVLIYAGYLYVHYKTYIYLF